MRHGDREERLAGAFRERYGHDPSLWVRAPGRVDLMGSHTDYNQGHVLTMTIDRDTWIAARPRPDGHIRVASLNMEGQAEFLVDDATPDPAVSWVNYVKGVAATCRAAGLPVLGFDGLVHSTVPFGSGLSSSAALEVATATLMARLGQWKIGAVELALLCQQAENQFVGVSCGILDQYSSALGQAGHALLLDCRTLSSSPVRMADDISVVICDTRARRRLSGSEYPERRAQCEAGVAVLKRRYPDVRALRDVTAAQLDDCAEGLAPVIMRRCRFIVEEESRVLALAGALDSNDWPAISALTADSYRGARDLYEIGTGHMESMMQAMQGGPGVIGARQSGAGFGGCMVALVRTADVQGFVSHVERAYAESTGIEPETYAVRPAPGAGICPGTAAT